MPKFFCKACGLAFGPNEPIHQPRHASGNFHKHCIPMNYKPLIVGDVRQRGDEVRHKVGYQNDNSFDEVDRLGEWRPARLLSHPILPADLVVCEFRRPV